MPSTNSMIKLPKSQKSIAGFQIYIPAVITLVAYVILAILILLPFEFPVTTDSGETYTVEYNFVHRLLTVLIMTIPIALSVYNINCLVSGDCLLWSYVVSLSTVFWVGVFIWTTFIYSWTKRD